MTNDPTATVKPEAGALPASLNYPFCSYLQHPVYQALRCTSVFPEEIIGSHLSGQCAEIMWRSDIQRVHSDWLG